MYPVICQFGPISIYSYGVSLSLAFAIATFLARQEAVTRGVGPEKILNLAIGLVICGVFGARLLYILQNLEFYLQYPAETIMLHKGGLSFYGGFILATVWALFFLRHQRLAIFATLDIIAPFLALAQAIGRIGCFLNGCCYGYPTNFSLAVRFPGELSTRHPIQLYSSLALLIIFIILRLIQTKKRKSAFSGEVFLLYCVFYSTLRFFIEYMRADNLRIWANLTLHQFISLAIFLISLLFWWKKCRSSLLSS